MSIPRNHHYVSKCQIKNFFNSKEGKIYLYDKELNNFFYKTTTKTVFSEIDNNSIPNLDFIDYTTLEADLKNNYEDNFVAAVIDIKKFLDGLIEFDDNLQNHLINLTKYGIAGEIRPPKYKFEMDRAIDQPLFEEILPIAAPELRKELEGLRDLLSKTKYSNSIVYSDFANKAFDLMGDVFFEIYYITGNGLFILPDRPSITQREKINEYFNPDIKEIAIIDIPLSSKIILHTESRKVRKGQNQIFYLTDEFQNFINEVNMRMLHYSYKQIACESEEYIKELIRRVSP